MNHNYRLESYRYYDVTYFLFTFRFLLLLALFLPLFFVLRTSHVAQDTAAPTQFRIISG
jgi:hypothetical protein